MTGPAAHPVWCWTDACSISAGGVHVSRSRIIPGDPADDLGRQLAVELVEARSGGPRVRLRRNGAVLLLSLDAARLLGRTMRDLSFAGKRTERR